MVGIARPGLFWGAPLRKKPAAKFFIPHGYVVPQNGLTVNTTAGRYVSVQWTVDRPTQYAGAWCWNSGTGDSGDLFKMAIHKDPNSIVGGQGPLEKSFGSVAFGATAAVNLAASPWLAAAGEYTLTFVTNAAVAMRVMGTQVLITNAGVLPGYPANDLGWYSGDLPNTANNYDNTPQFDYGAGTFANFPEANALALTDTESVNATCPLFGLYT